MCMYMLVQVEVDLWYLHRSRSILFFFFKIYFILKCVYVHMTRKGY